MRDAMSRLSNRSTHTGVSKYRAIVLTSPVGPGDVQTGQETTRRFSFRIRIPELHTALPDPCKAINTPDGSGLDDSVAKIVYMHPTAISVDLAGSTPDSAQAGLAPEPPRVGDIVWVEFEKSPGGGRMASPIYIAMCDRSSAMAQGGDGTAEAQPNNLTVGACLNLEGLFGNGQSLGQLRGAVQPFPSAPDYTSVEMSAEEAAEAESNYDNDDSIPNKSNHAHHFHVGNAQQGPMHAEFIPYVKKFIYECWNQKNINIQLNSGYRSIAYQRGLYEQWVAAGGRNSGQPKPSTSLSMHSLGMAFDFNPILPADVATQLGLPDGRKKIMSKDHPNIWTNSGIVDIAQQVGLRWGGIFGEYGTPQWDPIHCDWGYKYPSRAGRKKFNDEAIAAGTTPNLVPTTGVG